MIKSKKWLVCAVIFSQLAAILPVSVTAAERSENLTSERVPIFSEEQSQQEEKDGSETEPIHPEESLPSPDIQPEEPIEQEPAPELEGQPSPSPAPDLEEKPEPTPESTPKPVLPTPKPNQPTESDKPEELPTPEIKEAPSVPKLIEQPTEKQVARKFEVTPVKDTWDFIKDIGEEARRVGLEADLYASVMIAQAILESGSGQSQLSQAPYYNLFGIKGTYKGDGVSFKTQEDDGTGNLYTIDATFRQYESYDESLADYAKLLKEGLSHDKKFYRGAWKSETESYEEATGFLTSRYATDTQYHEKLNALIEAYALTSYDREKADLDNQEMIYPVNHPVVSSVFGPRWESFHRGVDFAAPMGTPIIASLSGTVIRSEFHASWGNYLAIEHENGLTTLYAHNQENLVKVGQTVDQGEVIALMGSTGNSTGPHLHFEVSLSPNLTQNELVDPLHVLPNR